MSFSAVIIILLCLGSILGGIFVLKKSAKKFDLTDQQLKNIKERNQQLDKNESDQE